MLGMVKGKITNFTTVGLLDDIINYVGPLSKIEYDGRIGAALKNFDQLMITMMMSQESIMKK